MDQYAVPNKLPSKQVNILAQRKTRINRKTTTGVKKSKRQVKREFFQNKFKKPEHFVANFRKAERDDNRVERTLLRHGIKKKFMKENSLVFVLRHRGTFVISEQCNTMLKLLGLGRLHHAVFLKLTPENQAMLSLVEPYVIYGHPTVQTVRDLIFKYGFIKHNGKKQAIKSNEMVEEIFKDSGVICVEDIVHEISTIGPNFDLVKSKLCAFDLPNPQDGWIGIKGLRYQKGGIAGFRGDQINSLLKTIL